MRRKLHKQRRVNTCAVASLRTVLDLQFDLQVAEEALEILGTAPDEPIKHFGTSTTQLRRMVKGASQALNAARPWRLRVKRNASCDDLARELAVGRFPIVSVHEPTPAADYHSVVVLAIEDDHVKIWDPASTARKPTRLTKQRFEAWWGGDGVQTWVGVVVGAYRPPAPPPAC